MNIIHIYFGSNMAEMEGIFKYISKHDDVYVDWIHVAQNKSTGGLFWMCHWSHKLWGISWLVEVLIAS
jgi:hypothetical protein